MKIRSTGTGITKRKWRVPETDEEQRSLLQELAEDKYSGDFARVAEIAEREATRILESKENPLIWADSPEAFAQSILQGIRVAKKAINEGDADLAAMMAFHAGLTWERARMKWSWEDDVLRSKKFTKIKGETDATTKRKAMLRTVLKGKDLLKRHQLTKYAWENGAQRLFKDYDQLYRFLKPSRIKEIFDVIVNRQK
jgi:hypothetical protein